MKVLYVILVSYASAGLAQAVLLYAYRSKNAQQYMISDDAHRSKSDRELYWRVALNIGVSITLILTLSHSTNATLDANVCLRSISSSSKSVIVLPSSTRVRRLVAPAAKKTSRR